MSTRRLCCVGGRVTEVNCRSSRVGQMARTRWRPMWCTRLPSSPGRWRRKYGSRKRQRQWARLIRRSAMRLSGSHKGLRCWPAPNRPRGSCRLDAGDGREDEQQAYSNNPESPQGCPGAYGPEHRCLLRGVALRHPSMAALSAPPRSPRFPKWDVAQRAPLSFSGIYTIAEHLCTRESCGAAD